MTQALAILVGFSDDITAVLQAAPETSRFFAVDENTQEGTQLPSADTVVYIFSPDTTYSSQLLSWSTWVHHHTGAKHEYILPIHGVDLGRGVFHFLNRAPVISLDELKRRLLNPTDKGRSR